MTGQEFLQSWMEKAKKNQKLDKEILEIINENLYNQIDENIILGTLLALSKEKGEDDEAN